MSNTKFTEGPWKAGDISEYSGITRIYGADDSLICEVEFESEKDDFNVHLLESSPLLYKALEELMELIMHPSIEADETIKEIVAARKALSSARGDSNDS